MVKGMKVLDEDMADASLDLARGLISKARFSSEKEKKVKNLKLARESIDKTIGFLGFE